MFKKISKMLNEKMCNMNTIYVLKGFNSIYNNLTIDKEHIFDLKLNLNIKNVFNIDKKKFINENINKLSIQKVYYCLYEELFFLNYFNVLGLIEMNDYNLTIIDLGVFDHYYPGFNDSNNQELLTMFNNDSSESNTIQLLYSNYNIQKDNVIIEYNEIETDTKINYIYLFNSFTDNYIHYNTTTESKVYEIFNNSTPQLLIKLFNDLVNNDITQINYIKLESNESIYLKKMLNMFNSLGINISYKQLYIENQKPSRYSEYLKILQRINSKYVFKDINLYKDPFRSNEINQINQSVIIDSIYTNILNAQEKKSFRDIFVTAPTGAGKSVLFQIPAILAAENNNLITLIISPLIGLMKDQVVNIKKMTSCAETINSEFTPYEKELIKEKIKNGTCSILYLSPETLLSNADITNIIGERQIGLLVVDEAHTVATWGKNFRPDYWYLGDYIDKLRHRTNQSFPIATFTATATIGNHNDDMYHDIIESLNMTPITYIGDVKRENINFEINVCHKDHAYAEEKDQKVLDRINSLIKSNQKTLVYFPYVSKLNEIAQYLDPAKIGKYFGGLDKTIKDETLDSIRFGNKNIVLATKAFGMGIDVKDIKNVYHFAPTGNLADYVQEIGRAARDPNMSGLAITDYYREDFRYINKLYGMSQITNYNIIGVLNKILYKYRTEKKRNFLMSTEEFSHIFNAINDDEIETKLKATILAIKKDFIKTTNYVPLIFKPRSMFTKGIFFIPDAKMPYIKSNNLLQYLTLKMDREKLNRIDSSGITRSYIGDLYEFDFKKCWQDKYNGINGLSFGDFKRKFYQNELADIDKKCFLDRMILTIEAKYDNFEIVVEKANRFLDNIKKALDDIKISNKHFSIDDLASKVYNCFNNTYPVRKLSNIMEPLLNILISVDHNITFGKDKFCEYNSQTDKYHIVSSYYYRIINNIKETIKAHFQNSLQEKTRISIVDSSKNKNNKMRSDILLVAVQLLELFDLVNYTFQAGDRPEFFIRVNSEKAIRKVVECTNYLSPTLTSIYDMHIESVKYMTFFFEELKTDKERWEFIENYFLGKVKEKYKINIDIKTKVKKLNDIEREKMFTNNEFINKKIITIYHIYHQEDNITSQYYISNKNEDIENAIKLSPECEVAKNLKFSKVGDVFKVNSYEYLVEHIENLEI